MEDLNITKTNNNVPANLWLVTCFVDHQTPWFDYTNSNIRYICGQQERCPSTGRLHWHFFISLIEQQRFSWIKHFLNLNTAHCDRVLNVDRFKARNYCQKEYTYVGGRFQHGTFDNRFKENKSESVEICMKNGECTVKMDFENFESIITKNAREKWEEELKEIKRKMEFERELMKLKRKWKFPNI